jgi:tetratricopeptide (TPR) repeat protein
MMKRAFLTAIVLIFVFALAAPSAADEVTQKLDELWKTRTGNTAPMIEALALAETAYAKGANFEIAWRAARACFWICDRTEAGATDVKYGALGYEWAQKAIDLKPGRVEGHYYYTLCIGEYGKGISIPKALTKGVGPKFEKSGKKALAINGKFDHGGIYRAWGRYYYQIPWPMYSFKKSEKYFLDGLKLFPKGPRGAYYLAELYVKEKKYDKAREVLNNLQTMEGYPDLQWETKYYKKQASALMKKIEGK